MQNNKFALRRAAAAILIAGTALAANAALYEGFVDAVHDGDTMTISVKDRKLPVRLIGFDAPELEQDYGKDAREMLTSLLLNRHVLINAEDTDQDGFTLAQVSADDIDSGLYMLEHGMGWVYRTSVSHISADWQGAYYEAEERARADSRGIWQEVSPIPPWTWRKTKRDEANAKREEEEQARQQSFDSLSKELELKLNGLKDAIKNPEQKKAQDERDTLERTTSWWQTFSDFGEILSRWLVAFFKSFLS